MSVAAAVAVVSCAQAQLFMRPGQAIVFSTPDDGDAASNAPSLAAQPPVTTGFGDTIHAPDFNFKTLPTTSTRLPAPLPTTISPAEADARANWALMTPEEILGIATPGEILQVPEHDADGQQKNPTAVERYYERQNQPQTNGSAGFLSDTPSLRGDFQDNEDSRLNANSFNPAGGRFRNPEQLTDPFQKPAPDDGTDAGQNGNAGWSKIFISSATPPVQSPSQAADMAEFQKLLEPSQPSSLTVKSSRPSSDGGFFSPSQTSPDSTFGQPVNPIGTPFGSLNSAIGGLPALPGIVGQSATPAATVPKWRPQLPPWMSQAPQLGVVPKRQF